MLAVNMADFWPGNPAGSFQCHLDNQIMQHIVSFSIKLTLEESELARLDGRKLLLTGAGAKSGIGKAAALAMAAEGAELALIDLRAEEVNELAAQIGAVGFACDLSDSASIAAVVRRAGEALGGLDGLCNIAGTARPARVEDTTLDDWNFVLSVNLTAPFLITQAALPFLRKGRDPAVANVSSGSALLPVGKALSSYVASKAGLVGLSKTMASELAPDIRVNVVCPGTIDTALLPDSMRALAADPEKSPYALKRAGRPEEVASALVYLMSPESSYVTGSVLTVDGGRTFH